MEARNAYRELCVYIEFLEVLTIDSCTFREAKKLYENWARLMTTCHGTSSNFPTEVPDSEFNEKFRKYLTWYNRSKNFWTAVGRLGLVDRSIECDPKIKESLRLVRGPNMLQPLLESIATSTIKYKVPEMIEVRHGAKSIQIVLD